MTELLTAAQMRAIERAAIESGAVTGLELMERAGKGVVEAIFDEWPELRATSHRAVVLCGPGNNGGDGFVVARLLKESGWQVRVLAAGPADAMPRDAAINARRWWALGPVEPLTEAALRAGPMNDLYVDAIFGTGLSRAPTGEIAEILMHVGGRGGDNAYYTPRLVAVDAPSVLCLDSGRSLLAAGGYLPQARLTVTFQALKAGHMLADGPELCGKVVVADIGLADWQRLDKPRRHQGRWSGALRPVRLGLVAPAPPDDVFASLHPGAVAPRMLGKGRWVAAKDTHKFTFGHALVLSGGVGRGGAARLTARAALRVGAGLVTLGCPPEAMAENAAQVNAVMLRPVVGAGELAGVLADKRINALCLGPGMGTGAREAALLATALGLHRPPPPSPPHEGEGGRTPPAAPLATHAARPDPTTTTATPTDHALPLPLVGRGEGWGADDEQAAHPTASEPPPLGKGGPPRPTVLDADALTLLAGDPALFAALHPGCILTPHAGEFARLFPDIAEKLAAPATKGPAFSKVDATRAAAARAGCVVLFKGPDTVIADRYGHCAINSAAYERAAPWLATAGSGDVLAGFITGLLARGFNPFDAACTGAWLHVECARSFGPGLIAEDLPEELPKVFRALDL